MMRMVPNIPPLYRDVPLLPSLNNADYRLDIWRALNAGDPRFLDVVMV